MLLVTMGLSILIKTYIGFNGWMVYNLYKYYEITGKSFNFLEDYFIIFNFILFYFDKIIKKYPLVIIYNYTNVANTYYLYYIKQFIFLLVKFLLLQPKKKTKVPKKKIISKVPKKKILANVYDINIFLNDCKK
jgi:hypothetical protein